LAQDREKARKKREEAAAQEKAEREERERAEQKADYARKLSQWRRWRAQSIPSEPGAEEKEAVRVSIRLSSGERVIRKFRADADLEELYAFVECYDILQEDTSEKGVPEPEGYEHEYTFQLVSPMPREVYGLDKGGSIRDRIGRSGNLIVENLVDEEGDVESDEA
jgi:FAS-associated factor 2